MAVGTSLSGGKIDEGCDIRETARSYALLGSRLAACKLLLTNKRSQKAGVTLDDCMREPVSAILDAPRVATPMVEPVRDTPVAPQTALPIAAPEPAPAPTRTAPPTTRLIGVCTFSQQVECAMPGVKPLGNPHGGPLSVSTICDQMLASAAKMLRDNPGTALLLVGNANSAERESNTMFPLSRAENVKRRLVKIGADPNRIQSKVGNGKNRTVEIFEIET
jgi:hypothetical protein